MNNIITCKLCNISINTRSFGNHVLKIHGQRHEDYIKNNLEDFKHLNWKLCIECGKLCNSRSSKCGTCYSKNHTTNNKPILCKHCDNLIHPKQMSQHLLKNHNIKFVEYVAENLNEFKQFGWSNCVICNKICKGHSKKYNEPTCSAECMGKLRETWTGGKSAMYGKTHSEESNKKNSDSHIGKKMPTITGILNPMKRLEIRKIISDKAKIRLSIPENNPMYGKKHTPEAIEKIFGYRGMNKLESRVADILKSQNIEYYYGFCIDEGQECKIYDFKIKGKPIILEIDGDYWHGGPGVKIHFKNVEKNKLNDKLKNEMAERRGYKVIRLWESDIKKDSSIILKSLIGL